MWCASFPPRPPQLSSSLPAQGAQGGLFRVRAQAWFRVRSLRRKPYTPPGRLRTSVCDPFRGFNTNWCWGWRLLVFQFHHGKWAIVANPKQAKRRCAPNRAATGRRKWPDIKACCANYTPFPRSECVATTGGGAYHSRSWRTEVAAISATNDTNLSERLAWPGVPALCR